MTEYDDSDSSEPPKKKAKSVANGDENGGPSIAVSAGKPKDASDKYQKVALAVNWLTVVVANRALFETSRLVHWVCTVCHVAHVGV
jgi:hypothetical protein